MNAFQPRQFTHRGYVEASAFLFAGPSARARVLAMWTPGATVLASEDAYVLLRAKPLRVRAETAPGLPFVAQRGVLVSAPLEDEALEGLPTGTLAIVHHGALELRPRPPPVDPSEWLDLSAFSIAAVQSLGDPPPALALATPPPTKDAREVLGSKIERPPVEQAELLQALARGGAAPKPQSSSGPPWWLRMFARVLGVLRSPASSRPAPAMRSLPAPAAPPAPSLLDRALDWMTRLLARSQLAEYFGRKHAEYLAKLLQMFENGDLDAALRHAIPLGGEVEKQLKVTPALLPPKPREKLEIGPKRTGAGSGIGLGGGLFDYLRERYKMAIERLIRAGRIEDAAFVYVELLRQPLEAVALLEKHDRRQLAAEIAEAQGLEPGLVVRQWFIAGNRARAVAIARRTGAFADAVNRLERDRPEQAEALRIMWADSVAAAGDYATAVNILWDLRPQTPLSRARILTWLDRAIELGGVAGARVMPRMIHLIPEAFSRIRDLAMPMLGSNDPDHRREREALATGLLLVHGTSEGPARASLDVLARQATRAMLRDGRSDMVERLVKATNDTLLRADLPAPAVLKVESLATRKDAVELVFEAADAGTRPAFDAAMLPDGKVLVALGEGGAALFARDGRQVAMFDRPAHAFVVSEHGDKAIAIARRGTRQMMSRIDLYSRQSESWLDAGLELVSSRFDGGLVYAFAKRRVLALDALSAEAKVLWSVDLEARVRALTATAAQLQFTVDSLSAGGLGFERWCYELPKHVLRDRRENKGRLRTQPQHLAISEQGALAWTVPYETPEGGSIYTLHCEAPGRDVEGTALYGTPLQLTMWGPFVACAFAREDAVTVTLRLVPSLAEKAVLRLGGAKAAGIRLDEHHLVVTDDRGRILVLDLATGRLVRDLRT